jgi:hypothetical protein
MMNSSARISMNGCTPAHKNVKRQNKYTSESQKMQTASANPIGSTSTETSTVSPPVTLVITIPYVSTCAHTNNTNIPMIPQDIAHNSLVVISG